MELDVKKGSKWSREETILAFDLYCKMPFSKISKSNKAIIELAGLIGRTPSSVGLKMSNLASFDPVLKARQVKGMANASKLDKEIFDEFISDWEELSYQAELIRAKLKGKGLGLPGVSDIPEGKETEREIKARVGQYFFRTSVLAAYGNRCCITGMRMPEMLVASHIKPWAHSDAKTERTNPANGLSLNALHDKAFDRGLITVDSNYRIVFSTKLNEIEMDNLSREWFLSYKGKQIMLPEKFLPERKFLEYHNDVVFIK